MNTTEPCDGIAKPHLYSMTRPYLFLLQFLFLF